MSWEGCRGLDSKQSCFSSWFGAWMWLNSQWQWGQWLGCTQPSDITINEDFKSNVTCQIWPPGWLSSVVPWHVLTCSRRRAAHLKDRKSPVSVEVFNSSITGQIILVRMPVVLLPLSVSSQQLRTLPQRREPASLQSMTLCSRLNALQFKAFVNNR